MAAKTFAWANRVNKTMAYGTGGNTPVAAWTPWIALLTAAVDQSWQAGTVTETTYTSYARTQMAGLAGPISGLVNNIAPVAFPTCTGGGPQTITHLGIFTASTAGELRYVIPMEAPRVVDSGVTPVFQIYDIRLGEW